MSVITERIIYFIITGALLLFVALAWFSVKTWINKVNTEFEKISLKFDKLIDEFRNIYESNATQDENLKSIHQRISIIDKRLDSHSERIYKISITQSSCKNRTSNIETE